MDLTENPNDPESWPDPPSEVVQPLLWRLGARLVADHRARPLTPPWQVGPICRGCGRAWPCPARRLGERGVLASMRQPELRPAVPLWLPRGVAAAPHRAAIGKAW